MCAQEFHCRQKQPSSYRPLPVVLHRVEVLQHPKQAVSLWNSGPAGLVKSRHHSALPINEACCLCCSSLDAAEFPG
jgi:hypothetical protein